MKKIRISKVKNIESLEFKVPNKGVHVLTGANGSGKTTLLAALHRIGYSNAFANFFKTTVNGQKIDFFGDSSIRYSIGSEHVDYNYGNTRWTPTPKRNNKLLSKFEFPQVTFIAADSKRIEATQDELKLDRIRPVESEIITEIKTILSDSKFDNLKYVNTKRGQGNRAYLIATRIKSKNYHFSEKNFSLGELCVLRLVTSLSSITSNSLVLIDEIEMALHPKAQIALFDYLLRVAKKKQLTVIFSTHSATLIKRTPREKILLLKSDGDGKIECLTNVYPAQALGEIAYVDEISPDFIFFVEDDKAKQLLEQMIEKYKLVAFEKLMSPSYKIIPVGGFKETIEFLINSDQLFRDEVKRYAFLDKDVETESIAEAIANEKHLFLQIIKDNKHKIKYLPCTPEKGIIDLISENAAHHAKKVKELFDGHAIDLDRIMDSTIYKSFNSEKPRKKAKYQFNYIISDISRKTGVSVEQCEKSFAYHYVNCQYVIDAGLHEIFGPIFRSP